MTRESSKRFGLPVEQNIPRVNGPSKKSSSSPPKRRNNLLNAGKIVLGAIVNSTVAMADPSFDCTGLLTPEESAICGHPKVAKLDRELHATYDIALSLSPDPGTVKAEQRDWLGRRGLCETNVQCLEEEYLDRLEALDLYRPEIPSKHLLEPGVYREKGTPWSPKEVTIQSCKDTQCFSLVWGSQHYLFNKELPIYEVHGKLIAIEIRMSEGGDCRYEIEPFQNNGFVVDEQGDCLGINPLRAPPVSGSFYLIDEASKLKFLPK